MLTDKHASRCLRHLVTLRLSRPGVGLSLNSSGREAARVIVSLDPTYTDPDPTVYA